MTNHAVTSVTKEERVVTVTCECGDSFDSMESESLARSYHSTHIRIMQKKVSR